MVLWAMSAFGAYSKTGQDLDQLGKAVSLVDSTMESLKSYSLTELDTLPSCPSTNYQYAYTVAKAGPTAKGLTLITITLAASDKATPSKNVYVVNVGD
jgi:hypothetical protein